MKQIYYAIQNIIRGKDSTIIKVVSLSLGLFLSIILLARVALELSFDTFYQDYEQLHVVQTAWENKDGKGKPSPYNIYPSGETLMKHFPEHVESSTVIYTFIGQTLKHGNENYSSKIVAADSLFFQTMGIPLIKGNVLDLNIPDAIFLSNTQARKIFGDQDPMGKVLIWGGSYEKVVKGIFADVPENVTIQTQAVISMNCVTNWKGWNSGGNYLTMLRMKEGADIDFINQRTSAVFANYLPISDHYGQYGISGIDISITPLKGYHLQQGKVMTMIYIMSLLAIILLLASAFNYALISISSLANRAKGIAIHKCSGAENVHIFGMFFWETFVVVMISVLIAIFLIFNFQANIEELTDATIQGMFSLQNLWASLVAIVVLFIIGCILPGRLLTSIPVTQVFRRYKKNRKGWKYPLLFIQFMSSAFLLCFVALIFSQYHYTMNKDLGWNAERLVYCYHAFDNPLNGLSNIRNLPYVEGVENANTVILEAYAPFSVKDENSTVLFFPRSNFANTDFCKMLNIKLIAGKYHTQPNELVVNQAFVKKMGWTSNGIGEIVPEMGTVTGIIEYSFPDRVEMEPYCIRWWNNEAETACLHVKLKEPFADNLQRLNEDMKKLYPQEEIVFKPVDDAMSNIFRSARIFRDSVLIACIVTLFITLLGVIGYTNDEVRRRSKEIAIRKVNGAEVSHILQMLCKDVAIIALPAVLIGTLASKYVGELWVSTNFRDILVISPLIYIGVGIVAMAFILGTVIVKSWRVANENPVVSIKSE